MTTMTTKDVCAYLRVSDCTVGRLVQSGRLAAVKAGPGRSCPYAFSRKSVEDFLKRQKVWPPVHGGTPVPIRERLLSRLVIDPSGCLLWTGARNDHGYGHLGLSGQGSPDVYVHRFMYELFAGPIPDGLELDHLCRVPHCASVAHLEPVTHAENLRRARAFLPPPKTDERTREAGRLRSARYRARRKAVAS